MYRNSAYTLTIAAPIPVILMYFDGKNTNIGNQLNWQTASEVNTDVFEIQRQINDGDKWETIGSVKSNNKGSKYQFLDKSPAATLQYYRLKIVDFGGHTDYTNTISIQNDKVTVAPIGLYPNPTKGILTINSNGRSLDQIEILNALGQVVLCVKSYSNNTLDLTSLPNGIYTVRVNSEGTVSSQQILKQ